MCESVLVNVSGDFKGKTIYFSKVTTEYCGSFFKRNEKDIIRELVEYGVCFVDGCKIVPQDEVYKK